MATEQFCNAATTLASNYTAGSGTLSVSSATGFPTAGNFRIRVGSNILKVTAVSGTTFTVVGGQESTTDANGTAGDAVTAVLTAAAMQLVQSAHPRASNTSNAVYTIDTTGNNPDVDIWHNRSGNTSYVLPPPTDGRSISWLDQTIAIGASANWVSFVPNAGEKINGSTGFSLTGTNFHFTNNSTAVSCTGGAFTLELYVGASIASSNQSGVNYIVSSITNDTNLVLTANFTGSTTTAATAKRTSLLVAANGVKMTIDSDGTDWVLAGDGTRTKISFAAGTGTYTFIPPAGTTDGEVIGCGGGGGGPGGSTPATGTNGGAGGCGGGGAWEIRAITSWSGNTKLSVVLGAGGTLGSAGGNGGIGGSTTFNGLTFHGAAGGSPGGANQGGTPFGVAVSGGTDATLIAARAANTSTTVVCVPGTGGASGAGGAAGGGAHGTGGSPGQLFAGGTGGSAGTFTTTAGSGGGGGGGGGSARGTGGNGGNGGAGETTVGGTGSGGSNAGSPTANSGAGGGAGGGGGAGTGGSGAGGSGTAGADGYLDVIYIL